MKTSTIVAVIVVLVVAGGALWYWQGSQMMSPTSQMGLNGSPNQGNLGQPDNGTPQGGDNGIGQNLILGVNAGSGSVTNYLSGYNGMTVYTYSPDTAVPGKSACTGTCAVNWPPYIVASAANINVSSATPGTVGTIARQDGSLQVTYNGQPLYFYIKDTQPGDTVGQGVGGVWYVVKP